MPQEVKPNDIESELAYESKEVARFNIPRVEIKENGILLVNGEKIEGLPEGITEFYVSLNGESVVASVNPQFKDREEKENKELMDERGYRSGVWEGHAVYILGYEGSDRTKLVIKSKENDTVFDQQETKTSNHLIGKKNYLDENKVRQSIPMIDGVLCENLRDYHIIDGSSPDLLQFNTTGSKTYFVDPANPSKMIPIEYRENEAPKINGVEWNSLSKEKIYSGGYRAKVDFENNKVMFLTSSENNNRDSSYMIVVNNRAWKNFNQQKEPPRNRGIQNGLPFVSTKNTLIIEDQIWNENPIITKDEKGREYSEIKHVAIGQKDGKVAIANQCNVSDKWTHEITEGDIRGPQKAWKNKIRVEKMTAGKDVVAVCGNDSEDNRILIVNDVVIKIKDDVSEFLDLTIKENTIHVTYKTAMGEIVTQEYELKEDSAKYEKLRIEKEKQEKDLHELQNMLFQLGSNPAEFITQFRELQQLADKKKNELEEKNKIVENINLQNKELDIKVSNLESKNKESELNLENTKTKLMKARMVLEKIQNILPDLTKNKLSSGFTISQNNKELIEHSLKQGLDDTKL